MQTIMKLSNLTTIDQLEQFLDGSQACAYDVQSSKDEQYTWVRKTLVQFRYMALAKREKGVVKQYLTKISGYSKSQLTRLIKQYVQTGQIIRRQQTQRGFPRIYTRIDIVLLAELDQNHETPCGAIIKKLCERIYEQTGESKYERLASISSSHIYNLRRSNTYQQKRRNFTKTQSKKSSIGERRKPKPEGQAGYLRVDTVHQGDQDKKKGVYHVNLVDEVTQFEITFSTEKISEQFMRPGLVGVLEMFPFKIRGFHSDNGSEYINKSVEELLNDLEVDFTKSRARQSNDNALIESKNASVIRKHFGHSYIPQHWASEINEKIQAPLYRYQNFHRPCHFSTTITNENGKKKKIYLYEKIMTPYEKLISLPDIEKDLKPGITLDYLKRFSELKNDNDAVKDLQKAKQEIFSKIFSQAA